MRLVDKTTARYHTDLLDERYHVDGRSKRKSSKAARRASTKRTLADAAESSVVLVIPHEAIAQWVIHHV